MEGGGAPISSVRQVSQHYLCYTCLAPIATSSFQDGILVMKRVSAHEVSLVSGIIVTCNCDMPDVRPPKLSDC